MCSFRLAGAVGGGRPEERRTPSRDRRSHARAPARRPRAPTRRTSHVLRRRYQPDELPPRTRRADVPARQRALPQTALLQEALLVQDRERVEREQHGLAKRPQGHRASGGRGRGAGSGSGCLRGVRCGANGWSFFRLIDDARVFARCQLPQPNLPRAIILGFSRKTHRGSDRSLHNFTVRSKLCLSAFESQTFRVHRDGRSALRVFGENKPPFWSQTAPRGAAGQTVFCPAARAYYFRRFRRLARALLRAHKHPTSSTVVATRVVVFHSLGSSTFYTATCPSPCPPPSRSTASPPSTPWAR